MDLAAGAHPHLCVKSYKLYSAESLIEDRSFDPCQGTDLPSASGADSWKSQPGLWVDLNAPVADLNRKDPFDASKKRMNYPIFDGTHLNSNGQLSLMKDANADIAGFVVNEYATRGVTMPLRWLYLLKDGTLASAKASGTAGDVLVVVPTGKEKTAQGEPNIVDGRVAFWTDDETSKVNINTASEGFFWDTPVSNGQPGIPGAGTAYRSVNDPVFEWDLAARQGAQKEDQRYPGHPATTSLSKIFGRQRLLRDNVGGDFAKMAEEPYKMTPRVSGAEYDAVNAPTFGTAAKDVSSKAGTARAGGAITSSSEAGAVVTPDGDRLYASIDEFLYNPNFGTTARQAWTLAPKLSSSTGRDTTREMLDLEKFFLTATRKEVNASYFQRFNLPAYNDSSLLNNGNHRMRQGLPHRGGEPGAAFGLLVKDLSGYNMGSAGNPGIMNPDLPAPINGVVNSLGQPGDWDTGPHVLRDGPYCNKADEGTKPHSVGGVDITLYIGDDYQHQDYQLQGTTFFSPNRQMPSPVMFGSLATGVLQNKPWQTLLFSPAKACLPGGIDHPGSANWGPPDHLLLDLFWMPVVEPWAISEPFATPGKINLNEQIAPFVNIKRDTGLRAVLKEVKITAMNPTQPVSNGNQPYIYNYKSMSIAGNNSGSNGAWGVISRRSIEIDNPLKQISNRQEQNRPFISASEICDIPLVPQDVPLVLNLPSPMKPHLSAGFSPTTSLAQFDTLLSTFWAAHKLNGDNALEKPYAYLYPRLTTRSNSYMVHVRAQTRAQNAQSTAYLLKANQAQPSGEFRGSFLIERYLDANSASLVDAAGNLVTMPARGETTGFSLGPYRFRIVSSKQFP